MATTIKKDVDDLLELELNNGDLKVLNDIVKKWNFLNKESAIRFALAVLATSKPGDLRNDGDVITPTDQLLKQG